MKSSRLIFFSAIAVLFFMTGCNSEGGQCKEVYNKVLKMYENGEIKGTLDSKDHYSLSGDARVQFIFRDGKKDEQRYEMHIVKHRGNSREEKEEYEKELKEEEEGIGRLLEVYDTPHEMFKKDNIIIVVPKRTNPKLEGRVYKLFMSYVQ